MSHVVILLFTMGVAVRLWFACTLPLILKQTDAVSRMQQAADWFKSPDGLPGGLVWLPVHHWLIGWPTLIGVPPLVAGRVVSLFFGIMFMVLAYKFSKLFFSKSVAVFVLAVVALQPFYVSYSITPMSELPFLVFVFAGWLCVKRWNQTGRQIYCTIAIGCLFMLNLIRFEGWIVTGFWVLHQFWTKKNPAQTLRFAWQASFAIVLYLITAFLSEGDPFYGLTVSDESVKAAYACRPADPQYITRSLSWGHVLPVWLLWLAPLGVFMSIKHYKNSVLLSLGLFLTTLISYKIAHQTNEPFWRYYATGLSLLLPFLCYGATELLKNNWRLLNPLLSVCIILLGCSLWQEHKLDSRNHMISPGVQAAAVWLNNIKDSKKKFIYNTDVEGNSFRLLTNSTAWQIYVPPRPDMSIFEHYRPFTDSVLLNLIRNEGFVYMVTQQGLLIDSILKTEHCRQLLREEKIRLQRVFYCQSVFIYKANH